MERARRRRRKTRMGDGANERTLQGGEGSTGRRARSHETGREERKRVMKRDEE